MLQLCSRGKYLSPDLCPKPRGPRTRIEWPPPLTRVPLKRSDPSQFVRGINVLITLLFLDHARTVTRVPPDPGQTNYGMSLERALRATCQQRPSAHVCVEIAQAMNLIETEFTIHRLSP